MTQVLADADLSEQLKALTGPARVVDEMGRTLGVFEPLTFAPSGWAKAHSPTSREEFERRRSRYRAMGEGKPLAEILARLNEGRGERA